MVKRDYYCSMKFRMMKVDTEKKLTYNCDPAVPHPVDFDWLKNNSGQLFNTPLTIAERKMMLNNQRNSSCEQCCWAAEDAGSISPRMIRKGYEKTHSDLHAEPEILDLTLGSDCNLTCSYCLKEYSSAWRQDLINNGNYNTVIIDDDRYTINIKDIVVSKLGQPIKKELSQTKILIEETRKISHNLKNLIITGGEPFLNNFLLEILDNFAHVPDIKVFSGLGVNIRRFERLVKELSTRSNVRLAISAESTDKFYEFNRYGMKWDDLVTKVNLLKQYNIKFRFHSVLSNLTILNYVEFRNRYPEIENDFDLVARPDFMSIYVLDDITKAKIITDLKESNIPNKNEFIQAMEPTPTEQQRINIKNFLIEFTKRRPDIDVTIYPKNFLNWIDYVV